MTELENTEVQVSRNIVSQNITIKNVSEETSQSPVDKNYVYQLDRDFIRIEYPGLVKNVPKAIETLGGMYNIEMVIHDSRKRLELRFHPDNKYNKACASEKDSSPGLLIKVRKKGNEYDYDIVGFVSSSYRFNRAADFQYLPLVQDDKTGSVEYVYNKIIPKKLPTLDYLVSKENLTIPTILLPCGFSRQDISHQTLYLKAGEKFNLDTNARPELFKIFESKQPREKFQYRQISHMVNITDPNLEIPTEPKELAERIIREKCLDDLHLKIKKLFEQRPMWIKAALQHQSGITTEMTKVLLPANAYFWTTGPWRMVWTRLGYDPRTNLTSRIYQTLDFRIRENEGTKIVIRAKRSQAHIRSEIVPKTVINETHYTLTPDCIPPARQMFYQYCDIKLPEIQEMMLRLPKGPGNQTFDVKNGWLPVNFAEQCREIANRYVMEKVHRELVEKSIRAQTDQREKEDPISHSSGMLNRMKGGFRRNIDVSQIKEEIGTVVLSSDDDSDEDIEQDDIPARLEDDEEEEEHISDNSEMELDMEAVEEINQIISETKKEEM